MWGFIKRRRELLRDQERVTALITMTAREVRGLTQQDFVDAGRALNIPPYFLHALYATESSGSGFDTNGRLKIAYEPHVVHRNTGGRLSGMRFDWHWRGKDIQVPLSYRKFIYVQDVPKHEWHPYREDDTGRWQLLAMAYEFEENALMGASYGGFQFLGEGAKYMGFRDTLDMIEHLYDGEAAHLETAIRFTRWKGGMRALQTGDSLAIERFWNGKYARGRYAAKYDANLNHLRKAYA